MGTISEKLTYLNETKQLLKDKINNLGGSIDEHTTFRQYANQLQNVYDNLPKTSYAEGSDITLSNTLKGKLDFEDGIVGIGDTKQEIDLTENNLTSQSANGLTITVNADKSITINGTATANTTINILNNTSNNTPATERTLEAGTYELTGCPSGSDSGTKFKLDVLRSGYIALLDSGSGDIKTLTSSQTYTYFRIQIFSGTQCNNLVFRPKLFKIPSPSYPQEIEVVRGKNLLDFSIIGKVPSINGGGLVDAPSGACTEYIEVYNTNHYTLSYTGNVYCYVFLYNSDKTYINSKQYTAGSNDISSIINSNQARYIRIRTDNISATQNAQLEKGSQATSYLPYNTIEEVVSGKNLLDIYNTRQAGYSVTTNGITFTWNDDGSISISGTSTSANAYVDIYSSTTKIIGKPGERVTYCLIGNTSNDVVCHIYDYADGTYKNNNAGTIIAGHTNLSNATGSLIRIIIPSNNVAVNVKVYPIIVEGAYSSSNLPTYEPYYTPQIKQLSLGEYEFAKIGNYRDYIYKNNGKWYKHKAINKVTLNGSENWVLNKSGNNYIYTLSITDYLREQVNISYCDHFICVENGTFGSMTNNQCRFRYYNDSNYSLYICFNDITTVTDFKNWLSTHNVVLYYILATATDTEITDTTLINQLEAWYNAKSFTGTVLIQGNGNLPMVIKVRALKGES